MQPHTKTRNKQASKQSNTRLDRFIHQNTTFSMSDTRLLIAQKRIQLDGTPASSIQQQVTQFTQVVLDGNSLQANTPVYIALHKPQGVVSATKDLQHTTVIDLLEYPGKSELHIAGRLDFNTTGLLILTNNGAWSRQITQPESKLVKTYHVSVSKPVNSEYIKAFKTGLYFAYENITTKPAHLEILSDFTARLSLIEGKYHQVKRMFGFFQNEVLTLHRESIGTITLNGLKLGESRLLSL